MRQIDWLDCGLTGLWYIPFSAAQWFVPRNWTDLSSLEARDHVTCGCQEISQGVSYSVPFFWTRGGIWITLEIPEDLWVCISHRIVMLWFYTPAVSKLWGLRQYLLNQKANKKKTEIFEHLSCFLGWGLGRGGFIFTFFNWGKIYMMWMSPL